MSKFQIRSTHDLNILISNNKIKLIDVRPVELYNGWKYGNQERGGHIPTARSLPLKWLSYMDWIEIVESKGITHNDEIVVYGNNNNEAELVAQKFNTLGFKYVSIYNNLYSEWIPNENLSVESLKNYKNLVSAEWVNALIHGIKPDEYSNDKYVICHSHYRNREAYLSGHIPCAIDMDTLALESPETWNRRSPEELKKALEEHGIDADTTVILYGKYMSPDNADEFPGSAAGHIGAIRNAFIMMYAGVKDVRILNGGFQSWIDAGFEIKKDDVKKSPVDNFGVEIPQHPELAVDIEEAKKIIKASDAELVSVRSWREFIGEVSGYNYIEKKGRIPGAIFGNCGSDAYHMENYRNLDHTTREYHEIEDIWKNAGISRDKHLAFYCGTGWRGSEAFLNAWLMGFERVSVFDGGWFEWSNDPQNPFETGIPQK